MKREINRLRFLGTICFAILAVIVFYSVANSQTVPSATVQVAQSGTSAFNFTVLQDLSVGQTITAKNLDVTDAASAGSLFISGKTFSNILAAENSIINTLDVAGKTTSENLAVNKILDVGEKTTTKILDVAEKATTKTLDVAEATKTGSLAVVNTITTQTLVASGRTKAASLEITGGSDLAELFEQSDLNSNIKPGTLVAIALDKPGQIKISSQAYDQTVIGVVSGSNGINPGLILRDSGTIADGKLSVALVGRVYCMADTSNGAIIPGDLLTTSSIPGHAMKVTDYNRAKGSIIGKAMTGLKNGEGTILVLISLQ